MRLNEFLQAEAARLGFTLFGIAPVARPPHLAAYESWIAAGLHASMDYLASERARTRRADPSLIQPEALALLVVGLRCFAPGYYAPYPIEGYDPRGEVLGRVAAYA